MPAGHCDVRRTSWNGTRDPPLYRSGTKQLGQPLVRITAYHQAERLRSERGRVSQILSLCPGDPITRCLQALLGESPRLDRVGHGRDRLSLRRLVLTDEDEIATGLKKSDGRLARRGGIGDALHQEVVAHDQPRETQLLP